ncbi:MAG: TIGR02444 family protein [Pseudomonadota bacterium]
MMSSETCESNDIIAEEFWNWSVTYYSRAGISDALLTLQNNYSANINLVLWCLWQSEHLLSLQEISDAASSIQPFNQSVTQKLREARVHLKSLRGPSETKHSSDLTGCADDDVADSLRKQILSVELEAERLEQKIIVSSQTHLPLSDGKQAPNKAIAQANLKTYLTFISVKAIDKKLETILLTNISPFTKPIPT